MNFISYIISTPEQLTLRYLIWKFISVAKLWPCCICVGTYQISTLILMNICEGKCQYYCIFMEEMAENSTTRNKALFSTIQLQLALSLSSFFYSPTQYYLEEPEEIITKIKNGRRKQITRLSIYSKLSIRTRGPVQSKHRKFTKTIIAARKRVKIIFMMCKHNI